MSGLAYTAQEQGAPPARWRERLRGMLVECQVEPCRRFTVAHRLLRRDGIYFRGAWCCSAACLESALHELTARELAAPQPGSGLPPLRSGRTPLRHILLRRGVLTDNQLQKALQLVAGQSCSLEQVLLQEGMATGEQLASARAEEAGVPFLCAASPGLQIASRLPELLMQRFRAATVSDTGGRLLLGFVDRVNRGLLQAVEQVTGLRALPCIIAEDLYLSQLATKLTLSSVDVLPLSVEDACARVVACAQQDGAEAVTAVVGQDWLWTRLTGGKRSDLAFPLSVLDGTAIGLAKQKRYM